jgi:hypothetical protein
VLQRSEITVSIPSSGRPDKAYRTKTQFLPGALIYVAEKEEFAYLAAGIPPESLRIHPNLQGMGRIRNFLLNDCRTNVCIQVDDDFESVLARPGLRMRTIRKPELLADIMYSTALVASDMGVSMFGWGTQAWPLNYRDHDPLGIRGPFGGASGTIGKLAKWDDRLLIAEDSDVIMRELLERRIVFQDKRYYWNFGKVAGGTGGLQSVRSKERCDKDKELLRTKWGGYVQFKDDQPGVAMSVTIPRKHSWVKD